MESLTKEGRVLTQETIELRPEFKSLWKAEEEYLESLDAAFLCSLRSKGKLIGILGVGKKSTDSYYDQDDVDLLMTMATEAAITIENARVLEELRKERLRAEELLDLTVQAQEDERKRVSVELHDSVAQWLVSASYRLQVCQALLSQPGNSATAGELSDIEKIIHNSIQELRAIMVGLHPPNLEELGFVPALRRTVEQLNQNGLVGKFHIEGDPERLPPHMELAIYRIVQESITNIRKHASATTVKVWLQPKQDQVSVEITDNGKGFNPTQVLGGALTVGHMGLMGMRQRAEALGGTLKIQSRQGAGTTISLVLPLDRSLPDEKGDETPAESDLEPVDEEKTTSKRGT